MLTVEQLWRNLELCITSKKRHWVFLEALSQVLNWATELSVRTQLHVHVALALWSSPTSLINLAFLEAILSLEGIF